MFNLKRCLILLNCLGLIFGLVFVEFGYTQGAKKEKGKPEPTLQKQLNSLTEENRSLTKKIKDLADKVDKLQKENVILYKEKAVLEAMLSLEDAGLKPPTWVKGVEKNLDKAIHVNLGFAYGLKGRIKEAIQQYQQALRYDLQDKNIHYNLGYLLTKDNRYNQAIEEYKKALTGLPQDREVYYNLAIIYAVFLKDYKVSNEYYQEFLRLSEAEAQRN